MFIGVCSLITFVECVWVNADQGRSELPTIVAYLLWRIRDDLIYLRDRDVADYHAARPAVAGLIVCGFISICSTEQGEIKTSTPPFPFLSVPSVFSSRAQQDGW